jgi:hypothetical protein
MLRVTLWLALVATLACAGSGVGPSVEETEVRTFRARVAAVDQTTRVVTLVNAAGDQVVFRADEAVQNLPQVDVGDEVVGELVEKLAVEVRPATAEEKAAPESLAEAVATAAPGQKPAGVFVRQLKALYTVAAIDKQAGAGMLQDAEGELHFVKVRDRAVLDRVEVGDTVVVTLTEALSLEVVTPGT